MFSELGIQKNFQRLPGHNVVFCSESSKVAYSLQGYKRHRDGGLWTRYTVFLCYYFSDKAEEEGKHNNSVPTYDQIMQAHSK